MTDRLQTARILRRAVDLLRNSVAPALLAVGLLTAIGTLFDIVEELPGDYLVTGIASILAQCEVTRLLLLQIGHPQVGRRYGPMLAIGLVSSIAIVCGFVFLVLPGLYLLARWSICNVVLLAKVPAEAPPLASAGNARDLRCFQSAPL